MRYATVLLLAALLLPLACVPQPGVTSRPQVPAFEHIFVVVEENHGDDEVIGNSAAPYLNSLATQYALATNYVALAHPSLPNYLALVGGSTFGVETDCTPDQCPIHARSLADNLEAAGRSWKAYMESMPAPCTAHDSGQYVVRHVPFIYFDGIRSDPARCASHIVPSSQLSADLGAAASTPAFVWLMPNLCNDMHNCPVSAGDDWLKANLPLIFKSPAWTSQNSVLFIAWDEDENNDNSESNQVPMLVLGSSVKPGYRSNAAYNHYSLLRTVELAWGLPTLSSEDAQAAPMSDFWR